MVCVCSYTFSWISEKERLEKCRDFQALFPYDTSHHAARILCEEDAQNLRNAKAWKARFTFDVNNEIRLWFKVKS